ncbi:DNA-directed DNA polymerase eta rad30 [Friedmanniomyces endolithicus]|nr:DNA-directed DNA polymerase eta rad30 [Friedmanniomyces endolithicus]
MTSSPNFFSSPTTATPHRTRRKSRFTYKHLSTLSHSSPTCPLRVIAHIDLDAFYAQCETVRLGIDPTKPLAVQQWQGLIAINYPARAFGLTRHVTIAEAKEKCPEIICQHVATWKEGEAKWTYDLESADAAREIATRKVSLDPYRIQSRRILAVIKDCLPADKQRVEKASIDEVFLDLSAQVHSLLLERYPDELGGPPPYDDPSEPLPRPPTTALDWAADALVDLNATTEHSEEDDPDWDDITTLLASEIVRDVRARIFTDLHYTCSAGLARNKMVAKLGSAHKKPNGQTVIRNRAIEHFLSAFKFTKIRNLGGKLGDEVVAAFNTELVSELLPVPIEQLKKQLGDDTGAWLYGIIRGEDTSEVNPRTQIKSMLSAKSFRPSINNFEVACKWLRIFVADIFSRLVEEGVLENKRRPRTINLHHRQGAQTRSRQAPIPLGRTQMTEEGLFELARTLLAQVIVDGRAWPCANLSLSVGGFEDGVKDNKGIGGFLVHGEEARALREQVVVEKVKSRGGGGRSEGPPVAKRRRVGEGAGITRFFAEYGKREGEERIEAAEIGRVARRVPAVGGEDGEEDEDDLSGTSDVEAEPQPEAVNAIQRPAAQDHPPSSQSLIDQVYPPEPGDPGGDLALNKQHDDTANNEDHEDHDDDAQLPTTLPDPPQNTYLCPRCHARLPISTKPEHDDFHFAQDLQHEASTPPAARPPPLKPAQSSKNETAGPRSPSSGGGGGGGGGGLGSRGSGSSGRGRGRGRPVGSGGLGGKERGQRKLAFG